MPTRQYVGARYVPKFYNNELDTPEWRPNVLYEPLTIVTYLNNSYTSKIQVPANVGAPDTNPQFWAATGNYNAQVDAYRAEVLAMDARLTADEKLFDFLKNRKIVFIGDSYAQSMGVNSWMNTAISILGLTSSNCAYFSGAGKGFIGAAGFGDYITMCSDPATGFDSMTIDHDEITDVYIIGGTNDTDADSNDLMTAMETFFNYCKSTFKNAKIYNGFCGYTTDNTKWTAYANTIRTYESKTLAMGVTWIDNLYYVLRQNSRIQSDQIHPTSVGGRFLGWAVVQAILKNGYTSVDIFDKQVMTYTSGVDNSDNPITWNSHLVNGHINIRGSHATIRMTNAITADTSAIIGTLADTCLIPSPDFLMRIPVILTCHSGGNLTDVISAFLHYDGQYMRIRPQVAIPAMTYFTIPDINLTVDTIVKNQ